MALAAHLQNQVTTLAVCWKVNLKDGTILCFTSNVLDLVFDLSDGDGSQTYNASTGVTPSDIQSSTGSSVDNNNIVGIINSSQVTDADILDGRYDNAKVVQFIVNYNDLTMGPVILMKGYVGQIQNSTTHFDAEIRSLNQLLSQNVGKVCTPSCMVKEFGDADCNVNGGNLAPYTYAGCTVVSYTDFRQFSFTLGSGSVADHYFAKGKLTWTSGPLNNRSMTVKDNVSGVLQMMMSMSLQPPPGSHFTLIAGCDRLVSTCFTEFNNVANFRGFPYIPGVDATLRIIPA